MIAFICGDFTVRGTTLIPGGCGYYRCILPMLASQQRAVAGRLAWDPIRGFGIRETETTGVFNFKTVVLKLIMNRWTPKQIEIAQSLGQRVIVDVDDFYEGLTEANAAFQETHPDHNKITNRENYGRVIAAANTVTVSTPFLLDHHSQNHPDVRMVRNGVNMNQFTRVTQNRRPVLGWTGSIKYRNNDLEQMREWLPDFLEEHDLMIHHAGHSPDSPTFQDVTGVNADRVRTSPAVPITDYATSFQFDIGLVPLNDIPFNHAKSNIKGLEYAANGIPFVASDLPEYRLLHEDGVGAIARTPEDWVNALTTLLPLAYRQKTAARQYQIVGERWSIDARAQEWQEVFTA